MGGSGSNGLQKAKLVTGTGIIINNEGNILTNVHVVNGCKSITVKGYNATAISASIEALDPKNDLAILKTDTIFDEAAVFRPRSKPAKLGENIAVIGYPLTGILSTEPKATFGQVNSVAGINNDYTLLQISAPIQGGNSGGPVLDAAGNVVGIVVSQASLALVAITGAVPQNVNFAIRSEIAQIFMTAHGIKFKTTEHPKKLENDEVAALGEKVAVFIACTRE